MNKRGWLAPLVALALVACGQRHTVEKPMADVYMSLVSLPSEADAMSLATIFPGTTHWVEPVGSDKIVWHFGRETGEYARYVAELSQNSPTSTTVTTHFEEGEGEVNMAFLRDIAKIASEASVSAALEGRAVDRAAVQAEIRQHIANNPMAAQMAVIQTVGEEMDRRAPPDPCDTDPKLKGSPFCK